MCNCDMWKFPRPEPIMCQYYLSPPVTILEVSLPTIGNLEVSHANISILLSLPLGQMSFTPWEN
jgi:hypothetical protein